MSFLTGSRCNLVTGLIWSLFLDLVINFAAVFWSILGRSIRSLGRDAVWVVQKSSLERIRDVLQGSYLLYHLSSTVIPFGENKGCVTRVLLTLPFK